MFVFLCCFVSTALAVLGIDVSESIDSSVASCLVGKGYTFGIVRAELCVRGTFDSSSPGTVAALRAGGFSHVGVYFYPCVGRSSCDTATNQIASMRSSLDQNNVNPDSVWLDVESGGVCPWGSQSENQAFYREFVDAAVAQWGQKVGIYSSRAMWQSMFGSTSWVSSSGDSSIRLWYAHYDSNPSFSDFSAFGSWNTPYVKQYVGDTSDCGAGAQSLDLNWAPDWSWSFAPTPPTPMPPPTPVPVVMCSDGSGVCQDNSMPCGVSYVANLCPGAANIQCCRMPNAQPTPQPQQPTPQPQQPTPQQPTPQVGQTPQYGFSYTGPAPSPSSYSMYTPFTYPQPPTPQQLPPPQQPTPQQLPPPQQPTPQQPTPQQLPPPQGPTPSQVPPPPSSRAPQSSHAPQSSRTPNSMITPAWPTYGPCMGVQGVCQDISHYCAQPYISFKCPGGNNIRCCPSSSASPGGAPPPIAPGKPPGGNSMCAGLVFPLAPGSLQHISVNWGGQRNGGARCHAGIDLFSQGAKKVIAIADGVVTGTMNNFLTCTCTGSSVAGGAVMVYHPSIGQTVNYGEITASSIQVSAGQHVTQGQWLGTAGACCMLHFELYSGNQWPNIRWYPASGHQATDPDGCTHTSMSTKDPKILDPRPLIACLKPPGASLLEDAGVGGEQGYEVASPHTIGGGYIALIVIVGVLVLSCVAVASVCWLRQRSRAVGADVGIENAAYAGAAASAATSLKSMPTVGAASDSTMFSARNDGSAAKFGTMFSARGDGSAATFESAELVRPASSYTCESCGKTFFHADDLAMHFEKNHGTSIRCPHCHRAWPNAAALEEHLERDHPL